jgi:AraC-like DNA-binding protein
MPKMEDYPGSYIYRRIVAAKLYIDANYAANIDLSGIAGEACFSKFHFIRLFKTIYACTPHQYLVRVRMSHAKRLLTASIPVARVCIEVGFESLGSFTTLFKRINKMTPSAYQAWQLRKRRAVVATPMRYVPGCFARTATCVL